MEPKRREGEDRPRTTPRSSPGLHAGCGGLVGAAVGVLSGSFFGQPVAWAASVGLAIVFAVMAARQGDEFWYRIGAPIRKCLEVLRILVPWG